MEPDPLAQGHPERLAFRVNPADLVGLPVRDDQGRQIGHVLSARQVPAGLEIHAHLSDPVALAGHADLTFLHPQPPPWVRGRRALLAGRSHE